MDDIFTKRLFGRVSSALNVRFRCGEREYQGTATNLSKNGMYISIREMSFPFAAQFEILILLKEEVLKIPAKVNRIIKSTDVYEGIGIELLNPPPRYIKLIEGLGALSVDTEIPYTFQK